ncbi:MAG: hypothetical protein ACLP50_22520 [Solirubrobacteraceae bacterium]
MNDPFDTLRAELVSAAARAELASPRRRWTWLRGRSHPVAVVIAALVVCGSAAAAAVSLSASSSQPLSGRVPGRVARLRAAGAISVAGDRYSIRVTPSLSSGSSGWAVFIAYKGPPFGGGLGGGGGGGYPTPTDPIFQGGGVAPWNIPSGTQSKGDSVGFVVTGPQVAAVRIGDRTIRTLTSRQLPSGDRVAVFFVGARAPTPIVGWGPGQPINSRLRVPEPGPHGLRGWTSIPTTTVLPLDSAGDVLPTAGPAPGYGYARGWSFWQAPSAVTPQIHEPRYHGRTRPRAGVCELAQHGLPGLTAEWGSTITGLPAVRDYVGELFTSCVSTEYYLHGWPIAAAVLLDARRPGAVLGPITGARPLPGHPDIVDFAGASLSARRVGSAWLVVQGGSSTTQRVMALKHLQIKKLDRRDLTP